MSGAGGIVSNGNVGSVNLLGEAACPSLRCRAADRGGLFRPFF